MRQLPVEGKRYQTMDRMWRKIMANAVQDPKVMAKYIEYGNLHVRMYPYEHHKYLYVLVIIIDAYTLGCDWEHFNAF